MRQAHLDAADGTRIAYFDTGGEGAPVVVLHGLAGSAVEFFDTADALSDFRVLLVEARGHGRSDRRPADVSREAHVSDVVTVIEAEVGAPVALIGQSMGGHTALLVAAARPDLVSRLVLLEAGVGGEGEGVGGFFHNWPQAFQTEADARAYLGAGQLADAWIADLEINANGLARRFDADVIDDTIAAVGRPRWAEWDNVIAPTLVVYAADGMFTHDQKEEFVSRGRDVRRVDLAGGTHDAHLDATDEWVAALGEFLILWRSPGRA